MKLKELNEWNNWSWSGRSKGKVVRVFN